MSEPPRHEAITQHYRDQIKSGELKPGEKLPTHRELATLWNVAGGTIARAMTTLREEGWISTNRAAGTTVARTRPAAAGNIASFATVVARQDGTEMDTVNTFTFANFVPAPDYVADALDLEPGEEAIKRVRTRHTVDGDPVLIAESWCPASYGHAVPRLLVLEDLPGGIGTIEEAVGNTVTHLVERVCAAMATTEQADFYGLKIPAPVIVKDHIWYADSDPFYYGRGWHRPDDWSVYRVEL